VFINDLSALINILDYPIIFNIAWSAHEIRGVKKNTISGIGKMTEKPENTEFIEQSFSNSSTRSGTAR